MVKKILRRVLTQRVINIFYHLPKAILANIVYGFPAREMKVIGVTGTDGKTTTVNMIYQVLKAAGKKVSMVSTINAVVGGKVYDTGFHVTSPDPLTIQKFAKQSKENGDEYLVLEVTSHALDQYRFWGIKFDVGVITNITHEHLDYHQTFENYFKTKLKLIKQVKFAVVPLANEFAAGITIRKLILGKMSKDWYINQALKRIQGKIITFGLRYGDFNQKQIKLKLKILGGYNIENALASLAVASALNIDKNLARKTLEDFKGIPGRMEFIKNNQGITIVIDFAHTPNGLEQALRSLRSQTWSGRLIAVFGSAGQRDVEKRRLMGEIAGNLADFIVVTAEDPRGELEIINKQIIGGVKKAGGTMGKNLFVINDRKEAIDFAINKLAKKADTVGIFGKGHELSMNLDGKKEIPWSDFKAVRKALDGQ